MRRICRWLGLAFCLVLGSATAGQAQQRGGTAVIAVSGDPGHLNPAISTAGPLHAVAGSLYNGLVGLDRDGNPVPDLAQAWVLSEDGLAATFTLRAEMRWHDGVKFTAADVKFSFEEALFRFHARARAGLAPVVAAIDTPDAQTVVFRLRRPHPALLRQLAVTEAPIIPRHVHAGQDLARSSGNLQPVGTGPFRFESYRRDDQIVLLRNAAYFKPGLPYLDRLVFRIIPDANTQVNAFLRGELDMLARISASDVARLANADIIRADTRAAPGGANCVMTLSFNLQRPVPGDARVRRAFSHAIDRAQLLDRVAFGQGRVAQAPIASGIAWAHLPESLSGITTDIALANRLLDEAGLARNAEGRRTSLDLLLFPAFGRYAELMRHHLASVGIDLRVRLLDPAAFVQSVFNDRDFDLALISYCNGTDPEIGVRRMYHSQAIGKVPFSNAAGYADGEVDRWFDAAGSTIDQEERARSYHAIQRKLARDLPYWWLIETDFTAVWRADLDGFTPWSGQLAEHAKRLR